MDPVDAGNTPVVPRHLYHALPGPQIEGGDVRDICVMRAEAIGIRDGRDTSTRRFELVDRYDPEVGFAVMERLAGRHAIIMNSPPEAMSPSACIPWSLRSRRCVSSKRCVCGDSISVRTLVDR